MTWHPLRFVPIYQERVWGGRAMEARLGRSLPVGRTIGESWEITDRVGAQSVVAEGPLAGRTLHELLEQDSEGLVGDAPLRAGRFPLLLKVLDAQSVLSLQVHPPAAVVDRLGGETKTELWYFLHASPGAEIFVGLRPAMTRERFESALAEGGGRVAECFHRFGVAVGDAMYLPSGRAHALGAGLLLFEVQENSDTTYRVYDWDRVGLDGRPRPLHRAESLASIDFADHEPGPLPRRWTSVATGGEVRPLVSGPPFGARVHRLPAGGEAAVARSGCELLAVVRGRVRVGAGAGVVELGPGETGLVPAALAGAPLRAVTEAEWLATWPC